MSPRPFPRKLYKYRAFNVFCLRLLTHAEVSFSDPRTFNDPLDCDPTIEIDINRSELEYLYYAFLRRTQLAPSSRAQLSVAANPRLRRLPWIPERDNWDASQPACGALEQGRFR